MPSTKQAAVIVTTVMLTVLYCVVFLPPMIHSPQCHDMRNDVGITRIKHEMISTDESGDLLRFVPVRNRSLKDCEDLFVGTPAAQFNMSPEYVQKNDAFLAEIKRVLAAQPQVVEGYSHQLPTMFKALHYMASRPTIKHICETGFNMGHSSFNFLTASKETIVHTFDLGNHGYAHSMADYMNRTFSGRFSVRFGDSTTTIPEFIRSKPDFRCDLIYVDGGHTYEVALADMLNLASLASDVTGGAVIIFDDYPSLLFDMKFGAAWEDMRRWGYVEEKMRCAFRAHGYNRGFVVGRVKEKPIL